jgi:integrase
MRNYSPRRSSSPSQLVTPQSPPSKIAYLNFIEAIASKETKEKYSYCFGLYLKFLKIDLDDIYKLLEQDKKTIEKSIISYVLYLKQEKFAFATINSRLAAILLFYTMNDIVINRKKIGKFQGEKIKAVKDRAYTKEEIKKIIENCDIKLKVVISLMASTGCRIGAIPKLKIRDLKYIEEYKLHQIIYYVGTKDEYYSFTTPECSKYIKEYLEYRSRSGENITNTSPFIRDTFKINDLPRIKSPRHLTKNALVYYIRTIVFKTGLRETKEGEEGEKEDKKETTSKDLKKSSRKIIALNHGFRKFVHTKMTLAKVDIEIREMLLGHSIGLSDSYYRPTLEQCLEEYLKAVDDLTINNEFRLQKQVQELKEKDDYQKYIIDTKISEKDEQINEMKNQIKMLTESQKEILECLKYPERLNHILNDK